MIRIHDPEFDAFVAKLASDHRIDDRAALKNVVLWAGIAAAVAPINRAMVEATDTLDQLDKPLGEIIRLLSNRINLGRLASALADESDALLDWLDRAERIRAAARKAHVQRGKGRPMGGLYAVVRGLAWYWRDTLGHEVTGAFKEKTKPPEPLKREGFTQFVFDVVMHICPGERAKLPQVVRRVVSEFKAKPR